MFCFLQIQFQTLGFKNTIMIQANSFITCVFFHVIKLQCNKCMCTQQMSLVLSQAEETNSVKDEISSQPLEVRLLLSL